MGALQSLPRVNNCAYMMNIHTLSVLHSLSLLAFYLLYAKLEEQYGLARHAMAIYDRATKSVLPEEQYEVS